MFIDASALTAILSEEPEADELLQRLTKAVDLLTSPLAIWETTVALARILDITPSEAVGAIRHFTALLNIREIAVTPAETAFAIEAFERYGKGRHPAGLNFGDCFAYACAKQRATPLLYKGDDFSQTDIAAG
ncbi:type II toxin-antitoxin system VapC family toxin [Rhizobium terrae]|uniref:type II toxin-antitoxin system VapC family toxin n=1 Tax=Rhizobium terrae TaxID=2171756 RepID=UPI000E3EBFFF|nr:type II toxin-antitoxin system VapC family toxin [Rhizobium terrae]